MALFQKQKQEKKRKGENVIGKIIYGFLLFAPLFNILVTCMYVTFNKNAYQSYYGETINEETYTEISNLRSDLILGNTYYCNKSTYTNSFNTNTGTYSNYIEVSNFTLISTTITTDFDFANVVKFAPYYNTQYNGRINLWFVDNLNNTLLITYNDNVIFTFTYNGNNLNSEWANTKFIYSVTYNKNSYLDNAFIYGTQKTEDSNLFNWAKTTGTYTVLTNVTTGIGITNTYIPMLMAYWLLISVVYFLFDIALILIWAVHDKIHELKDAI